LRAHRLVALAFALLRLAAPAAHAADAAIKPPLRGLISMGAYRFVSKGDDPVNTLAPLNAKPGIFGGIAIIATWSQLQSSPTSPIGDDNAIDEALAEVRAYNAANPDRPLGVKLRIWAGFEAPDWAMRLGGVPIAVDHAGKSRLLGRFWSAEYRAAWTRFQALLAAKYDAEPLIREVSVTSCMSFTAEPFYLPTEAPVQAPLRAAGFTDGAYRDCLADAVADYAPWKASRIVLAVNPFRSAAGQGSGDPAFTEEVMAACRKTLAARCVFDNHDLDADPPPAILPIHAAMQKFGPEIEFQTFRETPADFEGTITKGMALGASSIELWQDFQGFPLIPDATLRRWAELFAAQ
jgi:hypothetical protein